MIELPNIKDRTQSNINSLQFTPLKLNKKLSEYLLG
jgi:hypothetical protein